MTQDIPFARKHLLGCLALAVASSYSHQVMARGADSPIQYLGGSLTLDYISTKYSDPDSVPAEDHLNSENGQSLMLDFGFVGFGFAGETTINATADSALSAFKEAKYGDRVYDKSRQNGGQHVEIYNFSAERYGDNADLKLFYHVPRYHWHYEGDYFGLMKEATSIEDSDDFNEKAPIGVELIGKRAFDGLKIVGGKEIYWGAQSKAIAKYQFGDSKQHTLMASVDASNRYDEKKYSFQSELPFGEKGNLRFGILKSGQEKIGESYYRSEAGTVYQDQISDSDTWAFKAKVSEEFSPTLSLYTQFAYAGLVADQGEAYQEVWDTNLPFSSKGNKRTIEFGGQVRNGNYMVWPRVFIRDNLVNALSADAEAFGRTDPNNIGTGTYLRDAPDRDDAPFIVNDNREARVAEVFLTYDPTPGTFFYEWDNAWKEDAPIAYNLGLTYIDYKTKADQPVVMCDFGECSLGARPAEDLIRLSGRLVANLNDDVRMNLEVEAGDQIATDGNQAANNFQSLKYSVTYKDVNQFGFNYMTDVYGEEDYYADFGLRFPKVIELFYERRLDDGARPSKVRFELLQRDLDSGSGADFGDTTNGTNDSMQEMRLSYTKGF